MCFFVVKKKIKLYLFYNGVQIKRIVLKNEEDIYKPRAIWVIGHKEIYKKWLVRTIVTPRFLLHSDPSKNAIYVGVIDERGVEIE